MDALFLYFMSQIIVVLIIGSSIHQSSTTDFSYLLDTFLMGSVALNGIFNSLPLLFNHLPKAMAYDPLGHQNDSGAKSQVLGFIISVSLGIVTCTVLNIFW